MKLKALKWRHTVVSVANVGTRIVTNDDVKKYMPLVEKYIRDNVVKNWNEANLQDGNFDVSLGNSGMSISDIRQYLLTEVVVALQKYNPDYRTNEGAGVKEITFIYKHLFNRCGQLMAKLTLKKYGYGLWTQNLESTFDHSGEED
jgi:hypothetical protein